MDRPFSQQAPSPHRLRNPASSSAGYVSAANTVNNVNSSGVNPVQDAFLAFHQRNHGSSTVSQNNNTNNISIHNGLSQSSASETSPRLIERSINERDSRGRGRGRGGRGRGDSLHQDSGSRGGRGGRGRGQLLNAEFAGRGRGAVRGTFDTSARNNGLLRNQDGSPSRGAGPARQTYDADFDRGPPARSTGAEPPKLFDARVAARPTASAPSEPIKRVTTPDIREAPKHHEDSPNSNGIPLTSQPGIINTGIDLKSTTQQQKPNRNKANGRERRDRRGKQDTGDESTDNDGRADRAPRNNKEGKRRGKQPREPSNDSRPGTQIRQEAQQAEESDTPSRSLLQRDAITPVSPLSAAREATVLSSGPEEQLERRRGSLPQLAPEVDQNGMQVIHHHHHYYGGPRRGHGHGHHPRHHHAPGHAHGPPPPFDHHFPPLHGGPPGPPPPHGPGLPPFPPPPLFSHFGGRGRGHHGLPPPPQGDLFPPLGGPSHHHHPHPPPHEWHHGPHGPPPHMRHDMQRPSHPWRHDPMRIAMHKGHHAGTADGSVASFATQSASATSTVSTDYKTHKWGSAKDLLLDDEETDLSISSANPLARDLKYAYRQILSLESGIQERHLLADRIAAAAEGSQDFSDDEDGDELDDGFWVNLAASHMQLAEAYHSFMLQCVQSDMPTSFHMLPTKYDIVNRLWSNGFELLLERFRKSLGFSIDATIPVNSLAEREAVASQSSLTDRLNDFVYYAYNFYSHILEEPSLSTFNSAWLEQLGDIARYRMGLAAISASQAAESTSVPAISENTASKPGTPSKPGTIQLRKKGATAKGKLFNTRAQDDDLEEAETPAGNSIGVAALGDWELEEAEIWKNVARDWYSKGLVDSPGTGRLQHNLGLLSRGDDLRNCYHFAKSLCTSHPFADAREPFNALFPRDRQNERLMPEASAKSLFLYLQGLLVSREDLDSFPEIQARLSAKLSHTYELAQQEKTRLGKEAKIASLSDGLDRDGTWIMMAVLSISAVMQFGREDGILKKLIPQGKHKRERGGRSSKSSTTIGDDECSTISSSVYNGWHPLPSSRTHEDAHSLAAKVNKMTLDSLDIQGPPVEFVRALELMSALVKDACNKPHRPEGDDPAISPYLTSSLTFLAALAVQSPAILRILEPYIPWEALVKLFAQIPAHAHINLTNTSTRLFGTPLPEDWCLRGLEWTRSCSLFGRGYWKAYTKFSAGHVYLSAEGGSELYLVPEGESDVLDEYYEGPAMPPHAGGPSEQLHLNGTSTSPSVTSSLGKEGAGETFRETVARLRWKRIALCAAWFIRADSGLHLDSTGEKVEIGQALHDKIARWNAGLSGTANQPSMDQQEKQESMDNEVAADETEDDKLQQRPQPNHEVLDLLRQTRLTPSSIKSASKSSRTIIKKSTMSVLQDLTPAVVVPGYTTLVFSTDYLLTDYETFVSLLEGKRYTLVIPLAVLSELYKLSARDDLLGNASISAIQHLEQTQRSYPSNLKIQTCRGTYIRDITGNHSTSSEDQDPSTIDEMNVKAAQWQLQNWLDNRSLLKFSAEERRLAVPKDAAKVVIVTDDEAGLGKKAAVKGLQCVGSAKMGQAVLGQTKKESPEG